MPIELLAAMAAASEEIFKLFEWNREVFKFDREQRLVREELRMEMQMKRFDLFREDIRDLVELTVGRMDMYHLVGALFIEFCVVLMAEGRIHAVAPPFLLSLYHFSLACSFVYLLLTVWLAMHASIAAQSFGTRLLLRYVRLPVPTNAQIDALSANLAEYETQGVGNVLRIPFVQRPKWWNTEGTDAAPNGPAPAPAKSGPRLSFACVGKKYQEDSPKAILPGVRGRGQKKEGGGGGGGGGEALPDPDNRRIWLGKGEVPFSGEDDFLLSTGQLPGQHVELFRRLQAKWSCYDAYARVSLQFGVHHILIALSYFAIAVTMIENRSPTCGWSLVLLLTACQMGITALDMSTFARHFLLAMHSMSAAPLLAATMSVTWAGRHPNGGLDEDNLYPAAFLAFLFQLTWLELLLYVASPDSDDGRVPRKSRTVFYMDVFGEAEETNERRNTEQEEETKSGDDLSPKTANAHRRLQLHAESVKSALAVTRASVAVWESMHQDLLSEGQKRQLERFSGQLELVNKMIREQINWCVDRHVLPNYWADELARSDLRFSKAIVGPFEQSCDGGIEASFLDLETKDYISSVPPGREVITLAKIGNMLHELKTRARYLAESASEVNGGNAPAGVSKKIPRTPEETRSLLPWRVLRSITRLVQFCLAWLCFVSILRENDLWRMDYAEQPKGGEGEGAEEGPEHEGGHEEHGGHEAGHEERPEGGHPPPHGGEGHGQEHPGGATTPRPGAPHEEVGEPEGGEVDEGGEVGEGEQTGSTSRAPGRSERPAPTTTRPPHRNSHHRRLGHRSGRLPFQRLEAIWPYGLFFRPEVLSCLPAAFNAIPGPGLGPNLLVGSPFALYRAELPWDQAAGELPETQSPYSEGNEVWPPLRLREFAMERFLPATVAICASPEVSTGSTQPPCLLAAPTSKGVTIWSANQNHTSSEAVVLPVDGRPWRRLSGAAVRCGRVDAALLPLSGAQQADWCLLLTGWDGARLPIALLPLPHGPSSPPPAGVRIRPGLDVPLLTAKRPPSRGGRPPAPDPTLVALHVEPRRARLWALLSGGELRAWDLLRPRSLGQWPSSWPLEVGDFQGTALCEDDDHFLYVVGQTRGVGPMLLQADLLDSGKPGEAAALRLRGKPARGSEV